MNFKVKLKRINRGIVLAVIVLVIVVTYIIVDYARFSNSKDEVRREIEGYVKEFENIYTFEDSYVSKEGMKKEIKEERVKKYKEVIDKYWMDKKVKSQAFWGYNKTDMIENFIDADEKNIGYVKTCKYEIDESSMKISKIGPGVGKFSVTITQEIESCGEDMILTPFGRDWSFDYNGGNEVTATEKLKNVRITSNKEVEFIVARTEDGTWKIAGVNDMSFNEPTVENIGSGASGNAQKDSTDKEAE